MCSNKITILNGRWMMKDNGGTSYNEYQCCNSLFVWVTSKQCLISRLMTHASRWKQIFFCHSTHPIMLNNVWSFYWFKYKGVEGGDRCRATVLEKTTSIDLLPIVLFMPPHKTLSFFCVNNIKLAFHVPVGNIFVPQD